MPTILYQIPATLKKLYTEHNALWQLIAVALTYIAVNTGFDWKYFLFFRHTPFYKIFFPSAAILGFILPIIVPLTILLVGKLKKYQNLVATAWAIGQAEVIAVTVSSFYKIFTGRPGPEVIDSNSLIDISKIFRFGFYQGGAFWGWPSSHTTTAFAAATTLMVLYPKNKPVIIIALIYAVYISFGASISFHWFSDVIAGTILGVLIGLIVGKHFAKKLAQKPEII